MSEARKYSSIYDVPPRWRRLNGAALSHDQAEAIISAAEDFERAGDSFPVGLAKAREGFKAEHEVAGGQWVARNGGNAKRKQGGAS